MQTFRSGAAATPRHTTLATCLAAALTAASANAFAGNPRAPAAAHALDGTPSRLLQQAWAAARPPDSGLQSFDPRRILPNGTGTVRPVGNCNDTGAGSLRDTVALAADGDTIDLSALTCSVITLASGTISIDAADVTIQGPGQNKLRVVGDDANPVFATTSKYGNGTALNDLTISSGRSPAGGCVIALGTLVLERTTVSGCHAVGSGGNDALGGGVFVLGNLVLNASTVSGNSATSDGMVLGGGIVAGGTVYAFYGSRIEHNAATASGNARGGGIAAVAVGLADGARVSGNELSSIDGTAYGGGVFAAGSEDFTDPIVAVQSSTISGNSAHSEKRWSYGGGIQAGDNAQPPMTSGAIILIGSTISGNTVTSDCTSGCWSQGGGANAFGQILAMYSTIRDNQVQTAGAADGRAVGGGLATHSGSSWPPAYAAIMVTNSTVSGNQAVGGSSGLGACGGISPADASPFAVVFSTVTNNSASTFAGGVCEGASSVTSILIDSILANNHAPSGADLDTWSSSTVGFDGSHNLVMAIGENIDLPTGTLRSDPKLLPLANNGGLTATHALAACSPAIDAGTLSVRAHPDGGIEYDQRRDPYVRSYGAAPDIGAFESQPDLDRIFNDGFEPSPCP